MENEFAVGWETLSLINAGLAQGKIGAEAQASGFFIALNIFS